MNNKQRTGFSLKNITMATLALLTSQTAATGSTSYGMQALGEIASKASNTITGFISGGTTILSNDQLVDDENDYQEWMEFAAIASEILSEQDIMDLINNIPATGLVSGTGDHGSHHHRNLESTDETNPVLQMLKQIDSIKIQLHKMNEALQSGDTEYGFVQSNYITEETEFSKEKLLDAEWTNNKVKIQIKKSYKWLRTATQTFYKAFDKIQNQAFEGSEVDLYTEFYAQKAFKAFGQALEKSEKHLNNAQRKFSEVREKIDKVQTDLESKKEAYRANADGTSQEYKEYVQTERAIAYGSCAGYHVTNPSMTVVCYSTAAAIIETKIAEFKRLNEEKYNKIHNSISGVSLMDNDIEEIDYKMEDIEDLMDQAKGEIKQHNTSKTAYLTEGFMADTKSVFSDIYLALDKTMELDMNLNLCGEKNCFGK